jgi:hypothetical protein
MGFLNRTALALLPLSGSFVSAPADTSIPDAIAVYKRVRGEGIKFPEGQNMSGAGSSLSRTPSAAL